MRLHVHIVSDSTGETVTTVTQAALAQFEDVTPIEHVWSFVRAEPQVEVVLQEIEALPGIVFFTLVSAENRRVLEQGCERLNVPCVPILDSAVSALRNMLGATFKPQVGRQHEMNAGYFERIEAMNFMLRHDDGLFPEELDQADVVIVGVSRTSKTPTSLYLANRGIKAGNMPLVPGRPLPPGVEELTRPLVVGLTINPDALAQIRATRLRQIGLGASDPLGRFSQDYALTERIREEILTARRLFARRGWPVIDVTRRSVEETAAGIMQLWRTRGATFRRLVPDDRPEAGAEGSGRGDDDGPEHG